MSIVSATTVVSRAPAAHAQRSQLDAAPAVRVRVALDDSTTHQPISGGNVEFLNLNRAARSAANGTAVMSDVPLGVQAIRIRAIGYEALETSINVTRRPSADSDAILIDLVPLAVAAPAVRILDSSVRRRLPSEFEVRRKLGFGHFLDYKVFDANWDARLEEVLSAHVPGLRAMVDRRTGKRYLVSSQPQTTLRALGAPCPLDVYVDGVYRSGGFDFDEIPTDGVLAAEVYTPATTPPQFRSSASSSVCGVLVLWLK